MHDRLLGALNMAAATFFALCAFWQYNDPDTLLWTSVYLLAALACVLFSLRRLAVLAAVGFGVLVFVLGLTLAWRVVAQHQYFYDEEGREMMGSFVVSLYMAVLVLRLRRQTSA